MGEAVGDQEFSGEGHAFGICAGNGQLRSEEGGQLSEDISERDGIVRQTSRGPGVGIGGCPDDDGYIGAVHEDGERPGRHLKTRVRLFFREQDTALADIDFAALRVELELRSEDADAGFAGEHFEGGGRIALHLEVACAAEADRTILSEAARLEGQRSAFLERYGGVVRKHDGRSRGLLPDVHPRVVQRQSGKDDRHRGGSGGQSHDRPASPPGTVDTDSLAQTAYRAGRIEQPAPVMA